jgi:hypothetical protein
MPTFSELVKFRKDLAASIEHLQLDSAVNEKISELINVKKLNPNIDHNQINSYVQEFSQLIDANNQIISKVKEDILSITLEIDQLAKVLFDTAEQRSIFNNNNIHQLLELNDEQTEYIATRIGSYCDWLYPSLIVYPREMKWLLSTIVASDPLYLLQHKLINLRTLTAGFSEVYQNRLRFYNTDNDFSCLPQNQFKFVLLWDFLNYISFDQFEFYLREIFNLIKPGGSFMFSYNNCDLEGPAKISEVNGSSYANARIVEDLAKHIGFEIIKFENLATGNPTITHVSWVELRKSGALSTVKAHQALAKIIEK